MSFNGTGTYTPPPTEFPPIVKTTISVSKFVNLINDIATALNLMIAKDGQSTVTANIPMATFKFTGLGAGTALTDSASLTNLMNNTGVDCGAATGTVDAIVLTPSPAITTYTAGQHFVFRATGMNTGSVTVAVSGLSAKSILYRSGEALAAGEIRLGGAVVQIVYDGTQFLLANLPTRSRGSWVPSLGGNTTYTVQTGTYALIGNICFIAGKITVNALGTGSTTTMSNLPFNATEVCALTVGPTASLAVSPVSLNLETAVGAGTLVVTGRTAAAASSSSQAIFGNAASITFSGSYLV